MIPTLADLLADPARIAALPSEAVPQLFSELMRLQALLVTRLLATSGKQEVSDSEGDRLLDVTEAAKKLGLSRDALYRNHYPFVVKIGKHRRFSNKGIEKFIRNREGM